MNPFTRRLFDTEVSDLDGGGGGGSSAEPTSTGVVDTTLGSTGDISLDPGTGSTSFAWSDGWRERLAATSTDPDKELRQLARYESPDQIWKKARELERMVSSGELLHPKPDTKDEKELAKWREQMGIPAKPEEYKINMPAGVKAPPEDDQFLKAFLADAHAHDYSQGQVDSAISQFYKEVDRQIAATEEREAQLRQDTEDQLRQEWGADYRLNKNLAENLLARAPEGFRDRFWNGYLDDRTPINASPEAWKWLVQMEREINPAATLVPNTGGAPGQGIEDRLKELGAMRDAPKGSQENKFYWEGPGEQEYRDLLAAKAKIAERKGA